MLRTLTTTAAIALMTAPAFADGVSYARLSYDFDRYSVDDQDLDVGTLLGDIEYELGQFLLSAHLAHRSYDDGAGDASQTDYGVSGGWANSHRPRTARARPRKNQDGCRACRSAPAGIGPPACPLRATRAA
jgi:hypothetical protein